MDPNGTSPATNSGDQESRLDVGKDPNALTIGPGGGKVGRAPAAQPRLFGEYQLLAEIARGGMGVVYKARHVQLGRTVAIKMLLAGRVATSDEIKRFRVEAAAAAALEHPGIVPIYDFGEHAGRHYFSMAYVAGKSLATRLTEGPLPPRHAAELVRRVALAVQYAHSRGVIHRDLKPANVLLDKRGRPRITDFGLARMTARDSSLTQTGQILGTPSYMPPEQAAGKHDEVGPASDIYALGAILYHALTGRPPFLTASPIDTMRQVVEREPVPPRRLNPQVPTDLATIALHCLRKAPRDRYATAQALANDLARYLTDQEIEAQPVGIVERFATWRARNKQLTLLSSAFGYFILSVAVCVSVIVSPAREAAKSVAAQMLVMTFLAPWGWIVGAVLGFVLGGATRWLVGSGRRTTAARAAVQAGIALAGPTACVFIPLCAALAILLLAGIFPGYVMQRRLGRWVLLLMVFGLLWGIRRASTLANTVNDD